MNEREYDLLTATPAKRDQTSRESAESALSLPNRSTNRHRAINRADPFFRDLYIQGVLTADNASQLGSLDPDKQTKAKIALKAAKSIRRNGSDLAYRKAINEAVRDAFGLSRPSDLELAKKVCKKLSPKQQKELIAWLEGGAS